MKIRVREPPFLGVVLSLYTNQIIVCLFVNRILT